MNKRQPFAWWVPINGDTCFFKTYEEAKRERDSFESDFTAEDFAEGHYEPEPLYAAPAEDVRAVVDEPVQLVAVAVTREDDDEGLRLEWLLEGGISELDFAGTVLFAIPEANDLCADNGSADLYRHPQRPMQKGETDE